MSSFDYCSKCGKLIDMYHPEHDCCNSSYKTMTEEDLNNITEVPTPRIYPYLTGWNKNKQDVYTISIYSGDGLDITTELHAMTYEEVKQFIRDIDEQLELLHEYVSDSSETKAKGEDE